MKVFASKGAAISICAALVRREPAEARAVVLQPVEQLVDAAFDVTVVCVFRSNPITDSGRKRSLIPVQSDHPSWH